jgi:hypothetical protein
MTNRVAAAVTIEIQRIPLKPDRIGLDEAAQARMIQTVPVIVDAEGVEIFPSGEHEPVSIPADRTRVPISAPAGDRRLAERVIGVFLQAQVRLAAEQELHVAHRVEMIVDGAACVRLVAHQNLVRSGSVKVPGHEPTRAIPFGDWLPLIVGEHRRDAVDRSFHAPAQTIIGKLGAMASSGRRVGGDQLLLGVLGIRPAIVGPEIEFCIITHVSMACHRRVLIQVIGIKIGHRSIIGHTQAVD